MIPSIDNLLQISLIRNLKLPSNTPYISCYIVDINNQSQCSYRLMDSSVTNLASFESDRDDANNGKQVKSLLS